MADGGLAPRRRPAGSTSRAHRSAGAAPRRASCSCGRRRRSAARSCRGCAPSSPICAMARSRAIWMRVIGTICASGSRPQWPSRTAWRWASSSGSASCTSSDDVGHRILHAGARQVGAQHRHARLHRGHHDRPVVGPGPGLVVPAQRGLRPALRWRFRSGGRCPGLPPPSRWPAPPACPGAPMLRPPGARSRGDRRHRAARPAAAHRPAAAAPCALPPARHPTWASSSRSRRSGQRQDMAGSARRRTMC